MSAFRPIVIDPTTETPTQQLRPGAELDIPLEARFQELKTRYAGLILWMIDQRFPVPSDQIEYMQGVIR